jgi:hypothetical protein
MRLRPSSTNSDINYDIVIDINIDIKMLLIPQNIQEFKYKSKS